MPYMDWRPPAQKNYMNLIWRTAIETAAPVRIYRRQEQERIRGMIPEVDIVCHVAF